MFKHRKTKNQGGDIFPNKHDHEDLMLGGREIGVDQNLNKSHPTKKPSQQYLGEVRRGLTMARGEKGSPILFFNEDYEGMLPHEDDLIVISVVVVDYKIKKYVSQPGKLDKCALLEYPPINEDTSNIAPKMSKHFDKIIGQTN
ncbi:hypothetical protein CR513_38221, partial [Mucuna pruriens]